MRNARKMMTVFYPHLQQFIIIAWTVVRSQGEDYVTVWRELEIHKKFSREMSASKTLHLSVNKR